MHTKKRRSKQATRSQRGQILILVVFGIIGFVAFVGLVVDTGLVFIANGTLRRSVDAAALAAASQYRKNPDPTGLEKAADEFLTLNNVSNASATVHVCNTVYPTYHDPNLCTPPANRRLVRVDATSTVRLAFLPVIGINTVTLNATATSEAASLDIVLALDVSESMTWDSGQPSLMFDPAECNDVPAGSATTNCSPFKDIQSAAKQFVQNLFPASGINTYDRISVIPFDRTVHPDDAAYDKPLHLSANVDPNTLLPLSGAAYRQLILDKISALRVYTASGSADTGNALTDGSCLNPSGDLSYPTQGPCRSYPPNNSVYCFDQVTHLPLDTAWDDPTCFTQKDTTTGARSNGPYLRASDGLHYERAYNYMVCPPGVFAKYCGTTNIGEAFYQAGEEFVRPQGFRQESLWVVILLTDGITNHSSGNFYCPTGDGTDCQDASSATRHCLPAADSLYHALDFMYNLCTQAPPNGSGGTLTGTLGPPPDSGAFDADDYARAMADFVAVGQQALVYTIGFGNALGHCGTPPCDPTKDRGEQLLNYAADVGDDGKINTVGLNPNYFFAHDATALQAVFDAITDRIATRLTK